MQKINRQLENCPFVLKMYEYVKYIKVKSITEKAQRHVTNNNYFKFKKLYKEEVIMIVCQMGYFSIIVLRTNCLYPGGY